MVDFKKLVTKVEKNKKTHPCDIYETLDRASDKGPLRPVQYDILEIWHKEFSKVSPFVKTTFIFS